MEIIETPVLGGSSQIGPRTTGPRTVGPWGPICHFSRAESWGPDNWALGTNCPAPNLPRILVTIISGNMTKLSPTLEEKGKEVGNVSQRRKLQLWKSKQTKQIETKVKPVQSSGKNRQKRIRSFEEFSEKCQGSFWINSNYRNITPAHVCCGRIHKSLDSKSAKNEMVKIEEEDEDVATLGKKFEASKDMKKVEQAKTLDGQENDTVVVKTDLVRCKTFHHHNKGSRNIRKTVKKRWHCSLSAKPPP